MKNVRWAHAALLAVVLPACAHTSSNGEVENPADVQTEDGQPRHVPAESDWTAQGGETPSTHRLRPVFLAANTSDVNTTYPLRQEVIADAPSCDPWSADVEGRCDLSEMVTISIR